MQVSDRGVDTENEMSDVDASVELKDQYLNIFALVKARKQEPSSYETSEEVLVAHF